MADIVSVITSTFNGERYLVECIASILAQTVPPDEMIVVDDGSTDRSLAMAQSFGSPVRVVRQENRGQASAICAGLALATGTCLAFLDQDDLWTPQKQQWQLAALASDPELDMVFGLSEQFVSPELGAEEQRRFAPPVATLRAPVLQAATVRRRAFDRIGGINPALRGVGLIDWMARASAAGLKGLMLPDVVHRRRLHADNYGRTQTTERDRNLLAVLRNQIGRNRGGANRTRS